MEEIQTVDIKVEQEEDDWCGIGAETAFHPTTTDGGKVGGKTENGPTRWVVRGNVVKREYGQQVCQQGTHITVTWGYTSIQLNWI